MIKKSYLKLVAISIAIVAVISSANLNVSASTNGWNQVSGYWIYYYNNGKLATGWLISHGKWYYLDSYGIMQTGWIQWHGKWYYLNSYGIMQTGWIFNNGHDYYLNSDGSMATGWTLINMEWHYFYSDGTQAISTITPDGYTIDQSGIWNPPIPSNNSSNESSGSPLTETNPDLLIFDENLTSQWRAAYSQNKYNGIAFNKFENVLNAYAKGLKDATGKIDKYRIRGLNAKGESIGIKDPYGMVYFENNDPYDMGHKIWNEEGLFAKSNYLGIHGIQCNKAIVSGNTIAEIYENAKAWGLYTVDSTSINSSAINYDEVVIYKDSSTGKYTVARLLLPIVPTMKDPDEVTQPGYSFP